MVLYATILKCHCHIPFRFNIILDIGYSCLSNTSIRATRHKYGTAPAAAQQQNRCCCDTSELWPPVMAPPAPLAP